jgi:hypothetical protein
MLQTITSKGFICKNWQLVGKGSYWLNGCSSDRHYLSHIPGMEPLLGLFGLCDFWSLLIDIIVQDDVSYTAFKWLRHTTQNQNERSIDWYTLGWSCDSDHLRRLKWKNCAVRRHSPFSVINTQHYISHCITVYLLSLWYRLWLILRQWSNSLLNIITFFNQQPPQIPYEMYILSVGYYMGFRRVNLFRSCDKLQILIYHTGL